jgi:hypothetical protein
LNFNNTNISVLFAVFAVFCTNALVAQSPSSAKMPSNQTMLIHEMVESFKESSFDALLTDTFALRLVNATPSSYAELTHILKQRGFHLNDRFETYPVMTIEFFANNELIAINRKESERKLNANVSLTITDPDGNITSTKYFTIAVSDVIPAKSQASFESDWPPSKFNSIRQRGIISRFRKYGEPIILTAAIGTTVYLLYNIRSQ